VAKAHFSLVGICIRHMLGFMQATAAAPSPTSPSFAGLLAEYADPKRKKPPARDLDGLDDDVVTLSYENALFSQARVRATAAAVAREARAREGAAAQLAIAANDVAWDGAPDRDPGIGAGIRAETSAGIAAGERKRASITVRLSHAESEQLRLRATEAGLTVSAYLRSCAFEVESLRAQVKKTLAEMKQNRAAPGRDSWWRKLWTGKRKAA
jgi:hypothetical protein